MLPLSLLIAVLAIAVAAVAVVFSCRRTPSAYSMLTPSTVVDYFAHPDEADMQGSLMRYFPTPVTVTPMPATDAGHYLPVQRIKMANDTLAYPFPWGKITHSDHKRPMFAPLAR
jgi:hypothetical protein